MLLTKSALVQESVTEGRIVISNLKQVPLLLYLVLFICAHAFSNPRKFRWCREERSHTTAAGGIHSWQNLVQARCCRWCTVLAQLRRWAGVSAPFCGAHPGGC